MCFEEPIKTNALIRMKTSARVAELGEDETEADNNSSTFSCSKGISIASRSSSTASRHVVTRRRLSCVRLSASRRATAAPTPNIMPADAGGLNRQSSSERKPLSINAICRTSGSQPSLASGTGDAKSLASLKESTTSFFQAFRAPGVFEICRRRLKVWLMRLLGNDRERNSGVTAFVVIVVMTER